MFNIVIVIASKDILILEERFGVAFMFVLTQLTTHSLALIACEHDLLIEMYGAIGLLNIDFFAQGLASLHRIELLKVDNLILDVENCFLTCFFYLIETESHSDLK